MPLRKTQPTMAQQPQQNNNPFRSYAHDDVSPISPIVSPVEQLSLDSGKEVHSASEQTPPPPRSFDSEKQVTPVSHSQAGPSTAPMIVDVEQQNLNSSQPPLRDADKIAIDSWQSKSQEASAPISMAHHEDSSGLINDYKGAPPSYDSLTQRPSATSQSSNTTSIAAIEPDNAAILPPRPEDRSAVGQLLSWIPSQHLPHQNFPPLPQPIIIPQLDVPPKGESVPFVRCYSEALSTHSVSMHDFIAFLDGLAIAQAPGSAAQGLKMFGVGASRVPLPFIPLAGNAVKALASSGSGYSSSRAKLYLERAKREFFAPRGLRLSVVNDSDLNTRLNMPVHADRLAPLTKSTLSNNLPERRLEALSAYTSPLRYDVPHDEHISGVHKLARKHMQSQIDRKAKKLAGLREDQWKDISYSAFPQQEWEARYVAKMASVRRLQVFIAQNVAGGDPGAMREAWDALEREREELAALTRERQDGVQKMSAKGIAMEAELQEEVWARNLKWIVIDNL